jgi:hypothetical protein
MARKRLSGERTWITVYFEDPDRIKVELVAPSSGMVP